MKALVFDGTTIQLNDIDKPVPAKGATLIRVSKAGICNTDIEITRGYMPGFRGVPGHEFFGTIVHSSLPIDRSKRVTAEINCGCGVCVLCQTGDGRHCANRTVIGILGRNGAFAEYISVPNQTIKVIPEEIDDNNALFIEPLAAALEITDQISITPDHSVALFGDGKLGQLIAHVIKATGCDLTVIGNHDSKLEHLKSRGIATISITKYKPSLFDIVIEASGVPSGFLAALSSVKPRGTIILKRTCADDITFNPAPIVINEIAVIGSRCGCFDSAIGFLLERKIDLSYLIEETYPLDEALQAFDHACRKGSKKIIIDMK